MTHRITKCINTDCGYRSFNTDLKECSKCGGKLEVLASTIKDELGKTLEKN